MKQLNFFFVNKQKNPENKAFFLFSVLVQLILHGTCRLKWVDVGVRWGAREQERRHQEARKRELMVLIYRHLLEEGLKESADILGKYMSIINI